MIFLDIESGALVTLEQLEKEYHEAQAENPSEYNYSFSDYIRNCLTVNNGTLETIDK